MKKNSWLYRVMYGVIFTLLGMMSLGLYAQPASYPNKPVKLLIPFPPGGPADGIGRLMAVALSNSIRQTVFVENRGGAGGVIGAELVAQSPADGYTLMLLPSALVANASLYPKLTFQITRDFVSVSGLARFPLILVTHPSLPVKSVQDLIVLAKNKPGQLNFASAGSGGGAHLAAEEFKHLTGVTMTHIPYKGTGPAVTDTLGGQVNLMFGSVESVIEFIKSGKLRPLAVTSAKRIPILSDVPSMMEAGVKGYEMESWFAVVAPAGVSRPIVEYLSKELGLILKSQDYIEKVKAQGGEVLQLNAQQLTDFTKSESVRWEKIIKETGAKLD
ncbi:MAG: tripartite tricarboxylate transporter substrate binding protein [Betaproteobacteria bacterium]|jgi:tripartite-type tricarboxylate transporter receptor subunit TctC|nr:tripartite tricarboxylate transporter substrate binding protein [Polynucleobacter sp.]NBY63816.1 tripartite tricarboxylate transporter substrate binding protein [Betaproteobacteria bacterium]